MNNVALPTQEKELSREKFSQMLKISADSHTKIRAREKLALTKDISLCILFASGKKEDVDQQK